MPFAALKAAPGARTEGEVLFQGQNLYAPEVDAVQVRRRRPRHNKAISAAAPGHLAPGGWLLVEHGFEQGEAVRALFRAAGLEQVATERDLEHRDRVTLGRRPRDAG